LKNLDSFLVTIGGKAWESQQRQAHSSTEQTNQQGVKSHISWRESDSTRISVFRAIFFLENPNPESPFSQDFRC
jgi:hypothetical protein